MALARYAEERSTDAPSTGTGTMAAVDQKVLQGIFGRFNQQSNGGENGNS
jgi:hypothetical protein